MKKYFIFVLISFLFSGLILTNAKKPSINKIIVIDPGHGGVDPGTIYKDIYEKDINLKIGLYLKEELENIGYKVLLTRDGDYDLSKPNALYRKKSDFDNRILIINQSDYYLSIHLNYLNDSNYYGAQVFSLKDNTSDAKIVQEYLNNKFGFNRESKLIPKNIYMYQRLKARGLLIECGFLSNTNERQKLITEDYQKRLAKEISNAIRKISF